MNCVLTAIVIIVLYWLGLITSGCIAENVYNVLPDDSICEKDTCLHLSYLINNHQYYFTSNTTIVFSAEFYHIINNMIIQNVSNFSLVSTSESMIICSSHVFMGFYNIVNLTIKNFIFWKCGNSLNYYYHDSNQPYWTSILFHECTNVQIRNVYIEDPVGYGIIAINMFGHNTLENITVFMGRQKPYKNSTYQHFTCSYGIQLKYVDSRSIKAENIFITVSNIILLLMSEEKRQCSCVMHYYHKFRGMFVMFFKQHYYNVLFTLKDSVFSNLLGNVFVAYSESLANNSISFINCNFTNIRMTGNDSTTFHYALPPRYVLSFYYTTHYHYSNNSVTFTNCNFTFNDIYRDGGDNAIVYVVVQLITFNDVNDPVLIIRFKKIMFYENFFTLLKVTSTVIPLLREPPILIIADDSLHVNSNMADRLFYLSNAQVHFTGVVNFTGNILSTIIYSYSSKLIFTNTTIFHKNEECKHLLSLNGKWLYISLAEYANIAISDNVLENEIISVSKVFNHPFPYCVFQFGINYHKISINIVNNIEKLVNLKRSNSTINKLTSHCKLYQDHDLATIKDPLTIYKQIIKHKQKYQHHYPLGIHTNICYCPLFINYNCSVDQLSKVYPGQTLTVDMCLPYNNELNRILYVETYNDYLPPSACKVYSLVESKYKFDDKQSKNVNFTIASSHPLMCELFLTAQPELYTHYDTFYVELLPCPLGFTLQNEVCDCDPLLSLYIEKCSINYQTVKRLTNCWISGNTLNNSTKYYVANNCPIFFCSQLQTATLFNVQEPDIQCQQHRTGSLCSQCMPGYSLVLGSLECKKCTNAHLAFITVILFNGLLVLILIFILNFTVTVGTPNALILYLNVIRINDFSRNLESKLIEPFSAYIKICNLGSYFEMCVYDGMDMYTKKWIHFVFPTYLILIAYLIILGSRYSNKLFRLTHNRSLPVLATLFVFTYTNILETISSVFLFTTITSLPSNHSHTVWYLDPNIPLFGWKFLFLSIVSSALLILLVILNVILLFTKTFMRFRLIHRLKPFIDALQGPFKSQYYYWIGVHLLIRNVMLVICTLGEHLSIAIGCIMMMIAVVVQSYIQPYKNKMINFHEMILLCNYVTLWILLLFNEGELTNLIVLNVLVGISFLQLIFVVLCHIYFYAVAHHCSGIHNTARAACMKLKRCCWCSRQNDCRIHSYSETTELQIPQVTFNFSEFREPLLDVD